MASITWTGGNGDWTLAAGWSGGALPGAADTAILGGTGAYTVTLYAAEAVGGVTLNDTGALLYDDGLITLGPAGVFALRAGTLDLAYGALAGGTLVLSGGTLQAAGGMLNGVAVDGTLSLASAQASLIIQNGLAMAGASGTGAGTIALTGSNASLTFLGSQTLSNAVVALGAAPNSPAMGGAASLAVTHGAGSASGATLTIARSAWVREAGAQAQITVGGALPSAGTDTLLNAGTITAASYGGTLAIAGPGNFINTGTIGVSNGATLDIATAGFTNTGTITVSNATLDFGGTFSASRLSSLGPLSLSAATVEIGGTMLNGGNGLTIGAGTALGPLALAGTIIGGTVLDLGGGFNLAADTGVLDGVTYQGTLSLGQGAALTLADSTVLATAGGAGTASVTGAGASLMLECLSQTQTVLDNATIALGSSSASLAASLGTTDPWAPSSSTTAVLGPHLLIQQTGKYAAVNANAATPIVGYGPADTLINQGTISGAFAGGTLTLGGAGLLINQGTIAISNADTLCILSAGFSNTGTILIGGGATATLGGPANAYNQVPSWSNTGLISLSGGTLILSGAMRTGQIGRIAETGGGNMVTLAGTLANAGQTLTLGNAGLPALTLTGTIAGGAIADPTGLLTIGAGGTALLDGVSDIGTLNLTGAGAALRVRDGLTLSGAALVTGSGAWLGFQGSQIIDKATVLLGAASGAAATLDVIDDPAVYGGTTLTLGPNLIISQAGALAAIGAPTDQAGDAILSYGAINGAIAGGTLTLGGASFINRGRITIGNGETLTLAATQFSNTGTIALSGGAALAIAGSVTDAALGTLLLAAGSSVAVSGTLNNAGGTLALGAGTAWGRLSLTGTITGGVITDAGGGLSAAGGATLNGVAYQGTLDLSRPFAQLTVTGGLAVTTAASQPGTILLTGAGSRLIAGGSETLDGMTILLGSASQTYNGQRIAPPELAAGAQATLTLGAGALVRSAGLAGWLGDDTLGNWTDTIVNNGTVLAASSGGILTLGSTCFINNGGIAIGNGGNVAFTGAGMTNAGAISLNAGSSFMLSLLGYYQAPNAGATVFSNTGTIHMLGGLVQELTGNGLFPPVPIVNAGTGLIQGLGNVLAPVVNNGLIEAKFGPNLDLAGAITGTGVLQVDGGCVLELGGPVASSQTVSFTGAGETVRIDNPAAFAAHVANFITGDTLDIAGSPVTTVAVSAGTLVLGTNYGQFRLAATAPVGGEISVGADTHGGSAVSYLAQSPGGAVATIAVGQPKMLFWASPVGDAFTGFSANLQGATIANWTAADSLDLTDMIGAKAHLGYSQGSGVGTITVTDGVHTSAIGLLGTWTPGWFHLSTDAHGGALVTYGPSR